MNEVEYDIVIVGAGLGGVAAALRAGEMGAQVCLIEATDWIGGQLTAQGVCTPDENQWIETGGASLSYRLFRQHVRQFYRANYRLSQKGARQPHFNAGNCWVNYGFSVEPRVARLLLQEALTELPNVSLFLNLPVQAVEVDEDQIVSITAGATEAALTRFVASYFLDATDLGDLLPPAGVEHRLGAESRAQTGEPNAPEEEQPDWIQSFTFPVALEKRPAGENHTITPPPDYAQLKAQQNYSLVDGAINGMFTGLGLWTYRRVIASDNFQDLTEPYDVSTINTASNDFSAAIYPTGDPETDAATLDAARRATLGYVYWLQTECPRDDHPTRQGYPELRLKTEVFGTPDGIAPQPYIRQSRRIVAQKTVVQQDIGAAFNPPPRAAFFPDSCGIGDYPMDIHGPTTPNFDGNTRPFQIPLGALIPIRVTNLLAACKNLGVTYITNGAYRLHPIEWNVGEAAGALAAFCVAQGVLPRDVPENDLLLRAYQQELVEAGVSLFWWSDVPAEHPAFAATQMLAMQRIFAGYSDLSFRPNDPLTLAQKQALEGRVGSPLDWPHESLTRGGAAVWLAAQLGL